MATINLYEQRTTLNSDPRPLRVTGEDMGAGQGEAIQRAGAAVGDFSQGLERKRREDAQAWIAGALPKDRIKWIEELATAEESAEPGAPDFAKQQSDKFNKYKQEAIQRAPSDHAKRFYRERLDSLGVEIFERSKGFEARQGVKWRISQWEEAKSSIENLAAKDSEQAKIALAEQEAILDAAPNQELAQIHKKMLRRGAAVAAVAGQVERDPLKSLHELDAYLGISTPKTSQTPKSSKPAAPGLAPSAGGAQWDEVNAASALAAVEPERLMILEAEANNPAYDEKTRAGVRREIDRLKKTPAMAMPVYPMPSMVPEIPPDGKGRPSGNSWVDELDWNKAIELRNRAAADVQRISAKDRTSIQMRTKDVQSMTLSGADIPEGVAPTIAEYVSIHGQGGALLWQQEVGNYLEVGSGIKQMSSASLADRAQILDRAKPISGEGYAGKAQMHEALVQANALVEKKIMADPAEYADKAPMVSRARERMNAVITNPNATPEEIASATDAFAQASIAEQERLGVGVIRDERPGNETGKSRVKLLTNRQANAISERFYDMKGEDVAAITEGLEKTWGRYWPQVYGQLAQDNKLPPAALVIPNMSDPAAKQRMAQIARMKDDDLKALLAPTDPKDLRDALLSQFGASSSSFLAQGPSGNATIATVMKQAEKLSYFYRSQGKSITDSTKQAYQETMGWKYDFAGTYRVPKTEQQGLVSSGAQLFIRDIQDVQPFNAPGIRPETAKQQTLDAIRKNGMWVNNGDETGLQLVVKGQDGGQYQVNLPDGRPVNMSWAELRGVVANDKMRRATERGNSKASETQRRKNVYVPE